MFVRISRHVLVEVFGSSLKLNSSKYFLWAKWTMSTYSLNLTLKYVYTMKHVVCIHHSLIRDCGRFVLKLATREINPREMANVYVLAVKEDEGATRQIFGLQHDQIFFDLFYQRNVILEFIILDFKMIFLKKINLR